MVILSLFSFLLTVRIEGVFSGGDLRLATRLIIGQINKLRGVAASTRKEHGLVFQVGEASFYPLQSVPDHEGAMDETMAAEEPRPDTTHLPDGVTLEDVVLSTTGKVQQGEATIRFFANGCIERSLIHLRNQKDEAYTLEINPLTGYVTIHDTYIEKRVAE